MANMGSPKGGYQIINLNKTMFNINTETGVSQTVNFKGIFEQIQNGKAILLEDFYIKLPNVPSYEIISNFTPVTYNTNTGLVLSVTYGFNKALMHIALNGDVSIEIETN